MNCYIYFLFSTVLLWNIAESTKENGKNRIKDYPFMVQINSMGKRVCDGTIISADWVLTAADCVEKVNVADITIRYGTVISGQGGFTKGVKNKILHPEHNCTTKANDVALLEVSKRFPFINKKKLIKLARRNYSLEEGANATFVSWGIDRSDKDPSKYLDVVTLTLVNNTGCIKSNETEELPEGVLCAGRPDGDGNICLNGGGGGPLIVDNVQVAVAVTVSEEVCDNVMFISVSEHGTRTFIRQTAGV